MITARHVLLVAMLSALAGLAALTWALPIAPPAMAQTMTNAFGGLSESSSDPIDIESDVLVVHDKEKYATFRGNVKAVQGTTTLRAKELNVHYIGGGSLAPGAKEETKVAETKSGAAAKGAAARGRWAPIAFSRRW